MKKALPSSTLPLLLASIFTAFLTTGILPAHQAPTPEEIKKLKEQGIYEERLAQVRAMGNDNFSPQLLVKARRKMKKAQLEAQGLTPGEVANKLKTFEKKIKGQTKALPSDLQELPTTGEPRTLTLLVDFSDQRVSTTFPGMTASSIYDNIYGNGTTVARQNPPFDSVTAFYRRASQGTLNIRGNVLGFYTFPGTQLSYASLSARPDNQTLFNMVTEALRSFDNSHDFSQYDNDGDGDIDGLNILYTGQSGAWSTFWWAYQWSFFVPSAQTTRFDGKRLATFTWQRLETRPGTNDFNPRTMIHETGHLLGLPDLYDYKPNEGLEGGVGGFDIMDGNRGNPNGFFRWVLGWIEPTIISAGAPLRQVLQASGDIDAANENKAVVIFPDIGESTFQEFFLIENRHRTGNDDGGSRLPSNGLAIWHVDGTLNSAGTNFAFDNTDRNGATAHKLVKLVQADGREDVEQFGGGQVDAGDYFRRGLSFTPTSQPSSNAYNGSTTNIRVENISADGLTMTADIGFGGAAAQADLVDLGSTFHNLSSGSVNSGSQVTLTTRVSNAGGQAAPGFRISYYLSNNTSTFSTDHFLGSVNTAGLAAGENRDVAATLTIASSLPPGSYRLGWILDADAIVAESSESNNTIGTSTPLLQVTTGGVSAPNLVVLGVGQTVTPGDTTPRPADGTDFGQGSIGNQTRRTFELRNIGTAPLSFAGGGAAIEGAEASHFQLVNALPGSIAVSATASIEIAFQPTSAGRKTATVRIQSNDPLNPSYTYTITGDAVSSADDHGGTIATATSVGLNTSTPGNIEAVADEDFFQLTVPSSGTITVSTTGSTDVFGSLYNASGAILQEDDDSGDGQNFQIEYTASAATYYLRVRGYNGIRTGAYTLQVNFEADVVRDDYGNTLATATAVSLGGNIQGTLEQPGDLDVLSFQLATPGTLVISSTGTTDTLGILFRDGQEDPIASDDDSGISLNFSISADLQAGTHYLVIGGYSATATTGSYTISSTFTPLVTEDDHGDTELTATGILANGATAGTLGVAGDLDLFSVEIPGPGLLSAYTVGSTDTYGVLSNLESDDEGPALNFEIDAILSQGGRYFIAVRGFNGAETGDYVLITHFTSQSQADDHWNGPADGFATVIQPNSTTNGLLNAAGDTDYFQLTVTTSGVLSVFSSGTTDTYGFLRSADGFGIESDDDDALGSNFFLQNSVSPGVYFVQVEGYALTATGAYTLSAVFQPDTPDDFPDTTTGASLVELETSFSGALNSAGDLDYFRFVLDERRIVTLRGTGTTDTIGVLVDGSGNELLINDDENDSNRNFFLSRELAPGTYYLRVGGYENTVGAYGVELTTESVPVEPEELRITSVVLTSARTLTLQFNTVSGQTYQVRRSSTLATPSWEPVLSNIGGNGNTVSSDIPNQPTGRWFYQVREQP